MTVKRKAHQKQDTPRMQLAALLQSAWGNIHNQLPKVASVPRYVDFEATKLALASLEEAQKILKEMPEGEWDNETKS